VGCVPTKYLAKAAEVVHRAKMGYYPVVKATVEVRLGDLLRGAAGVVERLRREKYIDPLDYYGYRLRRGPRRPGLCQCGEGGG